jgi:hypothetical protein
MTENEIRTKNSKKQVKDKTCRWRPCCNFEGCINRADKGLCPIHKPKLSRKQTPLTRKIRFEKEPWKKNILEYLDKNKDVELLNIIAEEDKKKYNISKLSYLKKDDICEFKCKCNNIDTRDIRSMIKLERGVLCKECSLKEYSLKDIFKEVEEQFKELFVLKTRNRINIKNVRELNKEEKRLYKNFRSRIYHKYKVLENGDYKKAKINQSKKRTENGKAKKYRDENKEQIKTIQTNYYKENKYELQKKRKEWSLSYEGRKTIMLNEWTRKRREYPIKDTKERLNEIFDKYYYLENCELCNKTFQDFKDKCVDHCHLTGHTRFICCRKCNNNIGVTDRKRYNTLLELHKNIISNGNNISNKTIPVIKYTFTHVRIYDWLRQGFKHTDTELKEIFEKYNLIKNCEVCNKKFEDDVKKCTDHHHSSGCFRCVVCQKCNNKVATTDHRKTFMLLELHRYFIYDTE